jgi:16S rRNA processing protein RimM
VRGLVKIKVYVDNSDLLNGLLYTSSDQDSTLKINLKNSAGKYWIASIEGINDRTEALSLQGTNLYIDRQNLPAPDEDEFYISDLLGLDVYDTNKKHIGHICSVDNFGAGDLLEIQPNDGESFYINFSKENVPEITEKSVTIKV